MASPDPKKPSKKKAKEKKKEQISRRRTILIGTYLIVVTGVLIFALVSRWPEAVPDGDTANPTVREFSLQPDTTLSITGTLSGGLSTDPPDSMSLRVVSNSDAVVDTTLTIAPRALTGLDLFWLVLIVGALGACLHGLTSFGEYLGNKSFDKSWTMWYILRPLVGGVLAGIFHFVVRWGITQIDAKGFYASLGLAGLIGLFSKQALHKLGDFANVIFKSDAEDRLKNKLRKRDRPEIEDIELLPAAAGVGPRLRITGKGFVKDSRVKIDDQEHPTTFESETSLLAELGDIDPAQERVLEVTVVNPKSQGGESEVEEFRLPVTD